MEASNADFKEEQNKNILEVVQVNFAGLFTKKEFKFQLIYINLSLN